MLRLSFGGSFGAVSRKWFGRPGFSGPCPVGMHKWLDVAQTSVDQPRPHLHFAAFMRLQHGGFPGQVLCFGTLLTAVSQSARYTDHEFVADKTCHAAGLFPGNLVHEQMST